MSVSILLLFLTLISIAEVQAAPVAPPTLNFLAEKNGVRVLPQKFEYAVIDTEHLQIGDVLVDMRVLDIHAIKLPGEEHFRIKMSWPGNLIPNGQVSLRNSVRKTIWSENIDESRLQLKGSGRSNVRDQVATYTSEPVEDQLIDELKVQPFLLCSKDLYLSGTNILFRPRQLDPGPSSVEINGKEVSAQGVILLSSDKDAVSLRGQTPFGATLDIDTKRNAIEFVDVVALPGGENLRLTAVGADPVEEKKVKRLPFAKTWQVDLPVDRPFIYLKGHGGVALRQDFLVESQLPVESERPKLKFRPVKKTYIDKVSVEIVPPPGGEVGKVADKDTIENLKNKNLRWTLTQFETGQSNRRFLKVSKGNSERFVYLDVDRGTGHEARLGVLYKLSLKDSAGGASPPSHFAPYLSLNLSVGWWFEEPFKGEWARLHWGSYFKYQTSFIKKTGESNKADMSADLRYRIQPGLFRSDPAWGLLGNVYHLQLGTDSADMLGAGGFGSFSVRDLLPWFETFEVEGFYALAGLGSAKPSGSFKLEGDFFIKHKQRLYSYYGLEFENWEIATSTTLKSQLLRLRAGLNWTF